ncbi:hypothetical protein D3C81_1809730 [compost metagenome]
MADLDALALDDDAVAVAARLVLPAAVHRIEVEQMGVGRRVGGRVVDLHELQLRPAPGRAQGQTSDAAEAVDAYLDGHGLVLSSR